jgi:hypothetical protein
MSSRIPILLGLAAGALVAIVAFAAVVAFAPDSTASPSPTPATRVSPSPSPSPSSSGSAEPSVAPTPGSSPATSASVAPSPSASPLPTASATPSAAAGWSVATIEQPAAVGVVPPGVSPGLFCSPCHSGATTYVTGVATGGPGLVAVGLVLPSSYAVAWDSADGLDWRRTPDLGTEGTGAFAVTAGPSGLVAVGDQGRAAAAWRSTDGRAWQAASMPPLAGNGAAGLLAVAGRPNGYIAGGWLLGADGRSGAAIWDSTDGRAWTAAPSLPGATGAQVHGVAAVAQGAVAVGVSTAGPTDRAVAWVSTDGRVWRSATVDAADGSRMEAVIATPAGWLAVGSRDGSLSAASWTSTDGLTWHAAPEALALRNLGGSIHMLGVVPDTTGYVAVGWRDSAGNGNAVAWTSVDGMAWTRLPDDASLSGGGMAGVAVDEGRIVAIGTIGWPDDHFATIWVRPAR